MKNMTQQRKRSFFEIRNGWMPAYLMAALVIFAFPTVSYAATYDNLSDIPPADFCTTGTAVSQVENAGNITWTCQGSGTGTDASCSATRTPSGSCMVMHPAAWFVSGLNCIEYFAPVGSTAVITYMPAGSTRALFANYCPGGDCWGQMQISCPAGGGNFTVNSQSCNPGLVP